jgi:hypothetical protein
VVADATALHGTVFSGRVFSSDVYTHLYGAVLSLWKDEWVSAQKQVVCGETVSARVAILLQCHQGKGNCIHTPLTHGLLLLGELVSVETVVSNLL